MLEGLAAIGLAVLAFVAFSLVVRDRVNYAILRAVVALNSAPANHWRVPRSSPYSQPYRIDAHDRDTLPIPLVTDTSRITIHSNPPINTKHGGFC